MQADILVVDDESEIADLVDVYLRSEGFAVRKAATVAQALQLVAQQEPDLALLDVMLPDGDGFSLCIRLRENYFFPILMLTARVEDTDKITGLTLGADDYITKPFHPLELVARVKTQLRRYRQYNTGPRPQQPYRQCGAGAGHCQGDRRSPRGQHHRPKPGPTDPVYSHPARAVRKP